MKSGDSSGGVGNNALAPISAPIKMAEFRYGREEMLALFDRRTILPPDPLKQLQGLFVKDIQLPLALIKETEEETVSEPDIPYQDLFVKRDSSGGVGNNALAPISAPIKMAEFRYGREEMLALFDRRTILPPDPLKQLQGLFVKDIQLPLALINQTEEETNLNMNDKENKHLLEGIHSKEENPNESKSQSTSNSQKILRSRIPRPVFSELPKPGNSEERKKKVQQNIHLAAVSPSDQPTERKKSVHPRNPLQSPSSLGKSSDTKPNFPGRFTVVSKPLTLRQSSGTKQNLKSTISTPTVKNLHSNTVCSTTPLKRLKSSQETVQSVLSGTVEIDFPPGATPQTKPSQPMKVVDCLDVTTQSSKGSYGIQDVSFRKEVLSQSSSIDKKQELTSKTEETQRGYFAEDVTMPSVKSICSLNESYYSIKDHVTRNEVLSESSNISLHRELMTKPGKHQMTNLRNCYTPPPVPSMSRSVSSSCFLTPISSSVTSFFTSYEVESIPSEQIPSQSLSVSPHLKFVIEGSHKHPEEMPPNIGSGCPIRITPSTHGEESALMVSDKKFTRITNEDGIIQHYNNGKTISSTNIDINYAEESRLYHSDDSDTTQESYVLAREQSNPSGESIDIARFKSVQQNKVLTLPNDNIVQQKQVTLPIKDETVNMKKITLPSAIDNNVQTEEIIPNIDNSFQKSNVSPLPIVDDIVQPKEIIPPIDGVIFQKEEIVVPIKDGNCQPHKRTQPFNLTEAADDVLPSDATSKISQGLPADNKPGCWRPVLHRSRSDGDIGIEWAVESKGGFEVREAERRTAAAEETKQKRGQPQAGGEETSEQRPKKGDKGTSTKKERRKTLKKLSLQEARREQNSPDLAFEEWKITRSYNTWLRKFENTTKIEPLSKQNPFMKTASMIKDKLSGEHGDQILGLKMLRGLALEISYEPKVPTYEEKLVELLKEVFDKIEHFLSCGSPELTAEACVTVAWLSKELRLKLAEVETLQTVVTTLLHKATMGSEVEYMAKATLQFIYQYIHEPQLFDHLVHQLEEASDTNHKLYFTVAVLFLTVMEYWTPQELSPAIDSFQKGFIMMYNADVLCQAPLELAYWQFNWDNHRRAKRILVLLNEFNLKKLLNGIFIPEERPTQTELLSPISRTRSQNLNLDPEIQEVNNERQSQEKLLPRIRKGRSRSLNAEPGIEEKNKTKRFWETFKSKWKSTGKLENVAKPKLPEKNMFETITDTSVVEKTKKDKKKGRRHCSSFGGDSVSVTFSCSTISSLVSSASNPPKASTFVSTLMSTVVSSFCGLRRKKKKLRNQKKIQRKLRKLKKLKRKKKKKAEKMLTPMKSDSSQSLSDLVSYEEGELKDFLNVKKVPTSVINVFKKVKSNSSFQRDEEPSVGSSEPSALLAEGLPEDIPGFPEYEEAMVELKCKENHLAKVTEELVKLMSEHEKFVQKMEESYKRLTNLELELSNFTGKDPGIIFSAPNILMK